MAWDTEGTRTRIREAALEEFSAHGRDGTTVERIARRAGVNKERIYSYFGNKQALFVTILCEQLAQISESVPVDPDAPLELGEYVGQLYDHHRAHPHLNRLVLWEGLSFDGEVPDEAARSEYYRARVETIAARQRAGDIVDTVEPDALAFFLLALAGWWSAVPQIARMMSGPLDEDEHARRRANAMAAARVYQLRR